MITKEDLLEIINELEDNEPLAFYLITHNVLHEDAAALDLPSDCDTINCALERIQTLIDRRILVSPTLEHAGLEQAVSVMKVMATQSPETSTITRH